MKKNNHAWALLISLTLCLPTLVSAASLTGTWKGSAKKVTVAACNVPTNVVVTITQCKGSNLFNGKLQLGTNSIKIVGRLDPDNNFRAQGSDFSLTTASAQTALLIGKYIPSTSKIQISEFQFTSTKNPTAGLSEMYDIITLSK
jgi:hypothetical protein